MFAFDTVFLLESADVNSMILDVLSVFGRYSNVKTFHTSMETEKNMTEYP
jgi:hypothetical protein